MNNELIILEQSFDVPSDKVWKALTDNNQMKEWYFDIDSFRPEVGFKFHFTAGDDKRKYLHLCEITEVIPGKKISYSWRYDDFEGNSLLSFELFDEGNYKDESQMEFPDFNKFMEVIKTKFPGIDFSM